jgi:group II intron reverse transcriptase/maturase
MRFLTDWVVLNEAWRLVRTAGGAGTPGADGMVAADLAVDPAAVTSFLQNLADKLQSGRYTPGAVVRFKLAKPGRPGKFRPIAVLTLEDRVVHMLLKIVLEPMVEVQMDDRSFGFRPNRSRFDQINAVRRHLVLNPELYGAAVAADIASCFDELDHRLILDDVRKLVADRSVFALFHSVLRQATSGKVGWLNRRRVGVLQGSPLSPLLANWNLTRFDRTWRERHGDKAPLFRYADDLLVLARDRADASRLKRKVAECLRQTNNLALAQDKTRVCTADDGVPLLGLELKRHRDPYLNREDIYIFTDKARFGEVIAEVTRCLEGLDPARPLGVQFEELNQRLRGYFEAYQFAYDAPHAFEALDRHVFTTLRRQIKVACQCTVASLKRDFYHRQKDGRETWAADGVPLLVLSSLPRRQYRPSNMCLPWEAGNGEIPHSSDPDNGSIVVEPQSRLELVGTHDGHDLADPVLLAMVKAAARAQLPHDNAEERDSPHPPAAIRERHELPATEETSDDQTQSPSPTLPEGPEHAA